MASNNVRLTATPQLALIWGMSFIVVLFFMLVNFEKQVEFNSTIVFLSVLLTSIFGTLILVGSSKGQYLKGENTKFFFAQEITLQKLIIYFTIGLLGSFGWSTIAINLPVSGFANLSANEVSGLIALWGSGILFLFILIASKSLLPPVLAHGVFNAIVYALKSSGISQSLYPHSLPIPEIGLPLGQVNQIVTEGVFQVLLVALAEEHYKVLIIAVFLVAFRGVYGKSLFKVILAGLFAVSTWDILHLLQSLN